MRLLLLLLVFSILVAGMFQEPKKPEPPADNRSVIETIQLPPGFVIEKIAASPLVEFPMHVCFDEQGRMYVTEAAGVNRNGEQLKKELPNSIRLLTDKDGDGKFDEAVTFADKLTFPAGVCWHEGALYSCSIPHVWKLRDTNNDGIADERTPIAGKFGSIGNAADLHGPQIGPDGYLYFFDGRNGHDIKQPDGFTLKGRAAGMYRMKPDGTGLEKVITGGYDNPVEVAFSPAGEPFIACNLVLNAPRHDAVLFGIEGGYWPYDSKTYSEFPWTGDPLPMTGDLGWIAVAGITRYRHPSHFGADFINSYFIASFNGHKVDRHRISRSGASFEVTKEAFLSSNHIDFHPTHVVEAADGSLIVVDTGGWFRNGCPTSQIAKPNVKGAIYRIRKKDAVKVEDPRGNKLKWDATTSTNELINRLADARPIVADRAMLELSKRPDTMKKVISSSSKNAPNALWLAFRIGNDEAKTFLREKLASSNIDDQLLAIQLVGRGADQLGLEPLRKLLENENAALRRETAQALGRLKQPDSIPWLLDALQKPCDALLEHAIIYALIQIQQPSLTNIGLQSPNPAVQRGVLLALDAMANRPLSWELCGPLLASSDSRLRKELLRILGKHPEWAEAVSDQLDSLLKQCTKDPSKAEGVRNLLAALSSRPAIQNTISDLLACPDTTPLHLSILLEAMRLSTVSPWPKDWDKLLNQYLKQVPGESDELVVTTACQSNSRALDAELLRIATTINVAGPVRLLAAQAAVQGSGSVPEELFRFLVDKVRSEEISTKLSASRTFAAASKLNPTQLQALTEIVGKSGPMELGNLLRPFETADGVSLKALLPKLNTSPGLSSISAERITALVSKQPEEVQKLAEPLLKKLGQGTEQLRQRLVDLKSCLEGGDPQFGKAIFQGTKAACSACHQVGGVGSNIGPDLTNIAAIRSRADLMESIVIPAASIARGYESYSVETKSGKTVVGILSQETGDAIYLKTADKVEQRVLRSQIETMTSVTTSIMPAGLDQQLTKEELQHLLAYLMTLKAKK